MSRTFAKTEMTFADVTAIESAEVTLTTPQSVSDPALFSGKSATNQPLYGTWELNEFLLDGSREILPIAPTDVAFWSSEKSTSDGSFVSNPTYVAEFNENHTSAGLTLFFGNDYPTEVLISFYDLDGGKIESRTFFPNSLTYVAFIQVENYAKVVIEFKRTRLPGEFVQLRYVLFGFAINWADGQIYSASLHEEIDETSGTLAINTATVEIIDEDNSFDVSNKDGLWKSLQKTQPLTLTEYKDGALIPMGTFFIDNHSFSNNIATFNLVDAIGVMDTYPYTNGEVYTGKSAGEILRDIFAESGIDKYEIDPLIDDIQLHGALGAMSCREALQMVCFACNAVADCSRSDTVRVFFPDRYISQNIRTNRKLNGATTVSREEYVSGISITCNSYTLQSEISEICTAMLQVGENIIEFSNPVDPTTISSSIGTIVDAKTNYCIVSMDSDAECTISGRQYESSEFTILKKIQNIDANESPNIKEFSGITLYNPDKLWEICEWLLKYYALRKKVSMKFLAEDETVGNWTIIGDLSGTDSYALIESQDIDLSGGFIATTVCRGYNIVVTDFSYTGEISAGQTGVL